MALHVHVCACILGLLILPDETTEVICTRQDACTCESPHGLIDLRSVGRDDGTARFFISSSGSERGDDLSTIEDHQPFYYYNPCYPFNVGPTTSSDSGCKDVAVCQYSSSDPQFVDLGHQQEAVFGYSAERQALYINYTTTATNLSSRVYLYCRTGTENSLDWNSMVDTTPTFNLHSHCACYDGCVQGVSPGTIICVVLACLIATYLVVGILYRKAVHGATGFQLLPNSIFWSSLPGLIKDGYLFFISPCWTSAAQDSRYEQL
ncbi:uncharacterized protein LOC117344197 [Pecten maximus]|uniref:uncharacterized protein LOC117344197 n=1 Tax=Pecten maximus TaxID=6579 RepID=UPI001458E561|nr:uncharacterized protein LOC117344197 [Pecten maximus]